MFLSGGVTQHDQSPMSIFYSCHFLAWVGSGIRCHGMNCQSHELPMSWVANKGITCQRVRVANGMSCPLHDLLMAWVANVMSCQWQELPMGRVANGMGHQWHNYWIYDSFPSPSSITIPTGQLSLVPKKNYSHITGYMIHFHSMNSWS
jgi:hypothetical protein